MCARPLLPDSELKHPRRIGRRSTTKAPSDAYIKPASARIKKKWKMLLDIVIKQIILNKPLNTLPKRNKVRIDWKDKQPPKGFPYGIRVKGLDTNTIISYNAELVLLYLHSIGVTKITPTELYEARRAVVNSLTRMENEINEIIGEDL